MDRLAGPGIQCANGRHRTEPSRNSRHRVKQMRWIVYGPLAALEAGRRWYETGPVAGRDELEAVLSAKAAHGAGYGR
jgi:hypothetical protein